MMPWHSPARRRAVALLLAAGLLMLGAAAWLWARSIRPAAPAPTPPAAASATPAAKATATQTATGTPATAAPATTASTTDAPATAAPTTAPAATSGLAFAPTLLSGYDAAAPALNCAPTAGPAGATLAGTAAQWQPLQLRLTGPAAAEADSDPNPFLDYRLLVRFVGPSGRAYVVPGYFDGDGQGGGAGDQWAARFAADEPGRWRWCASFRAGPGVAVSLDPAAGEPLPFDGAAGAFDVAPASPGAPGFFALGRLEYAGGHYLKFHGGPYWLKTGTNSPENFLAYSGFEDATGSDAPFLHRYAPHVSDWRPGDPTLPGAADEGKGIIGALNYLAAAGVNAIYFLPMTLGGDGNDTWPFLSPTDVTHYDIGKLAQWRVVFEHAQRQGILLHIVLNETEPANRRWFDGGETVADILSPPRRLFYRELVARFADLPAIKWNLSEESVFSRDEAIALAGYLGALDWAGHPIAVHNPADWFGPLEDILGRPEFAMTSIQYQIDDAGALAEAWRASSAAAGQPWVVELDENRPAQEGLTPDNAGALRKTVLYDALFSGAGGVEWYLGYHPLPVGGDLNVEDFRTRAEMWAYAAHARRFLEAHTPFWLMAPGDDLLAGEAADYGGGEVLALPGEVYAVYLPSAALPATLAVPDGDYSLRWYDPRTGEFAGEPLALTAAAGQLLLGLPPSSPPSDWVALVTVPAYTPPPPAYP